MSTNPEVAPPRTETFVEKVSAYGATPEQALQRIRPEDLDAFNPDRDLPAWNPFERERVFNNTRTMLAYLEQNGERRAQNQRVHTALSTLRTRLDEQTVYNSPITGDIARQPRLVAALLGTLGVFHLAEKLIARNRAPQRPFLIKALNAVGFIGLLSFLQRQFGPASAEAGTPQSQPESPQAVAAVQAQVETMRGFASGPWENIDRTLEGLDAQLAQLPDVRVLALLQPVNQALAQRDPPPLIVQKNERRQWRVANMPEASAAVQRQLQPMIQAAATGGPAVDQILTGLDQTFAALPDPQVQQMLAPVNEALGRRTPPLVILKNPQGRWRVVERPQESPTMTDGNLMNGEAVELEGQRYEIGVTRPNIITVNGNRWRFVGRGQAALANFSIDTASLNSSRALNLNASYVVTNRILTTILNGLNIPTSGTRQKELTTQEAQELLVHLGGQSTPYTFTVTVNSSRGVQSYTLALERMA